MGRRAKTAEMFLRMCSFSVEGLIRCVSTSLLLPLIWVTPTHSDFCGSPPDGSLGIGEKCVCVHIRCDRFVGLPLLEAESRPIERVSQVDVQFQCGGAYTMCVQFLCCFLNAFPFRWCRYGLPLSHIHSWQLNPTSVLH